MTQLGQTTRILRIEVPVDDEWHIMRVPSTPILHVYSRQPHLVEFWIRESETSADGVMAYRVYGTGQPTPAAANYEGTAIAAGGRLVWHLLSVVPTP